MAVQPPQFGDFQCHTWRSSKSAIISVTLQLPFQITLRKDICRRDKHSSTTGLLDYLSHEQHAWDHFNVAWPGVIDAEGQDRSSLPLAVSTGAMSKLKKWQELNMGVPVWLGARFEESTQNWILEDQLRWGKYGNRILYPLFHYQLDNEEQLSKETEFWRDYQTMNAVYCRCIADIYRPGDIVWIHDHHFFLLPRLLRKVHPDIVVGFQLDMPWPSAEVLRSLTRRVPILRGLLASNLIAFQGAADASHLAASGNRIFTVKGMKDLSRRTQMMCIGTFYHGSIDNGISLSDCNDDAMLMERVGSFMKQIGDRKMIISFDRADRTDDILLKVRSFRRFLETYEEWQGKVVLVQITGPIPGEGLGDKISHKIRVEQERLNADYREFPGLDVHIHIRIQSQLADKLIELFRMADVGLMTSGRGPVDRYALDYVACQKEKHGPLIVSEFAETGNWLETALQVNPNNHEDVAEAILHALTMPEGERAWRHQEAMGPIALATPSSYANNFIQMLLRAHQESELYKPQRPLLSESELPQKYSRAMVRIFFFDLDGTLVPLVDDASMVSLSQECKDLLGCLANDMRNHVWIVSGRDHAFLEEKFVDLPKLGLCAEHGCFIRYPMGAEWVSLLKETEDLRWQKALVPILEEMTAETPGSHVEKKIVAVAWHYRMAEPQLGAKMASELMFKLATEFESEHDTETFAGNRVVEVRPKEINKGRALKHILKHVLPRVSKTKFVFCAGDDVTDEDMFQALDESTSVPQRRIFTCAVGPAEKITQARWRVKTPGELISELKRLADTTG